MLCVLWIDKIIYGFPHCPKVHYIPLCFYERPTLVPVITNWKKSEKYIHFYEIIITSLYTIVAYEVFRRKLYFWIAEET